MWNSTLDFFARRVLDLDRLPAFYARAGLAVRAQAGLADLAYERGVTAGVTELDDLVVEGARPDVGVLGKARLQVRDETLDGARPGAPAFARRPLPFQIGLDRPAVPAEVTGDRRVRPPSFPECMCFHVFSMCEHGLGSFQRLGTVNPTSLEGAHRPIGGPFLFGPPRHSGPVQVQ